MDRRWETAEPVSDEFRARFPELHPVAIQLLGNRGLETQEQVDEFLLPDYGHDLHDPFLFREMQAACERIFLAIEKQERVVVHGDYDADGVSGTAILLTAFREVAVLAGGDPSLFVSYIPHREHEGYGLNSDTVRRLATDGCTLLITIDCGISNAEEISLAKELGIETIVVDHHQVPEHIPKCILIHPLVPGETYPYGNLAAAGVAFKVATALYEVARRRNLEVPVGREKWLLDLVAIATVTDFMKLIGENRTLEKWGLVVLNKTRRPGLQQLIQSAGLELGRLDTVSVGFYIGPRINAASRMDHADLALETVLAEDAGRAAELATQLNACNVDRQKLTEEIVRQARLVIEDGCRIQILVGDGWSAGVVGIVAGRFTTELGVPVFVLGRQDDGRFVGSGRSIPGFDVMQLLRRAENSLARFGGHPEACGLTIVGDDNLVEFRRLAKEYADEVLADHDLRPVLRVECELQTSQIDWSLISELERFEPFGVGNPRPLFLLSGLQLRSVQSVGRDGKHVRVSVLGDRPQETKLIGFGLAARLTEFSSGDRIDAVVELGVNQWNGTRTIQVRLVDIRSGGTIS
ncbi:single-stranded-DNA-specific exonuclease RecJ [Candidatus Uhrbacteria bacterium RIFOXYC2_FULL_47_19]|uniref:Single-stranded-DNA-specific exonuclease RecJ n=1 Tax=Candidatus Uhrbacteria bacterium RIFOXYC2_FULL_47_19 TaxID=1802424 RepID=A0A1F7WDB9_9BACT|nr:MAG: single-stranded-DNA-specific exonuclease RecJ [Candidatus Uhrbacteria bacterium RIFOXYC2_FULL_47_19]